MTATAVIEEIRHLPPGEQSRVLQFAFELARERQLSGKEIHQNLFATRTNRNRRRMELNFAGEAFLEVKNLSIKSRFSLGSLRHTGFNVPVDNNH